MSLPLPEQLSRNRSASTGDSGLPQHEHKRPRLSEGPGPFEKTSLTISTHDTRNTSSSSQPSTNSPLHSNQITKSPLASPPQSPLPTTQTPDATSPQSKVTINTRPISSQSSNVNVRLEILHDNMSSTNAHTSNPQSSDQPTSSTQDDHHETISISSSEGGSPLIQVAAPEDLDQDPAETHWEPLLGSDSSRQLPIRSGYVQNTFPFTSHDSRAHNLIAPISKAFMEGDLNQDDAFTKTKAWLVDFANRASDLDYNFFEEDREFWQRFPNLSSSLLKRRVDLPTDFDTDELAEFFTAFARISATILDADVKKLQSYSDTTDPRNIANPRCLGYVTQLNWILTADGIPLYERVQESLNVNPRLVTDAISDRLLQSQPERYIRSIIVLFKLMADQFTKRASLVEGAFNLAQQSSFFISVLAGRANSSTDSENASDRLTKLFSVTSEFLDSINAVLDRAITKQQPWLNIESCDKIIKLVGMFVDHLVFVFPHLALDLVSAANVRTSDFQGLEVSNIASSAWKFVTLQKLIKKGRMEVRVACVQLMATELLDTYNHHIRPASKGAFQPRIDFFTQFIRRNDLIRYLIGVNSHPQIIERCYNIMGFLCHTRTYSNEDTDVIWHAVSESQDPRAVTAILALVQQNLDALNPDMLYYLVERLLELPFDRFDFSMLEFSVQLISMINHKVSRDLTTRQDETKINECTVKVCFRLLREANTPARICSDLSARIRHQIHSILSQKMRFLRSNFSNTDDMSFMQDMVMELCENIRAHNEFSTGSAFAVSTILFDADHDECSQIIHEYDLATLLIEDLLHACDVIQSSGLRDYTEVEFENRYQLLNTLVVYASHAITDQFIEQLWTKVLSSSELNSQIRHLAWLGLGNIFDMSRRRNEVLDTIVDKYLPSLSPAVYDSAVFHFVRQSVKYETRHTSVDLTQSQSTIVVPGIDRVWNLMLTAPANTVEVPALQFIIEQYLDGDRISRCNPSCVEATHLALIDRSVSQVIEAANRLQGIQDVGMREVQKPAHAKGSLTLGSHETRFHRSLLFLRKFLDNLKARPRYTPAVNENLKRMLGTFEKKGNLFDVTLQILGHKALTSAQVKWMLGCDSTGSEVWQFLSELTGWSQFTIINGGKRFALKDNPAGIQEIGIRTGSFMVNKVPGSPENAPKRLVRASSPVDNKVMHHFDELYKLLDLEDQFAKEVFDFLRMFSSQEEVVEKLKSMSIPADQLLPVEKPFKLMYYARALRSCIEDESFNSDPDPEFLSYGVKTILSVLSKLTQVQAELSTRIAIAQNLIDVLNLAFRAPVPAEVSLTYISNGAQFCKDMIALWDRAIAVGESDPSQPGVSTLIRLPFEVLIEGLLHDERLWSHLVRDEFMQCLERSLLLHPLRDVRQATLEVIHGLTGANNLKTMGKNSVSRIPRARFPSAVIDNCLTELWGMIVVRLHQADSAAATCEEYFDAVACIFQQHQSKIAESDLLNHVEYWKGLILNHQHKHRIGLAPHDFFISSLGKLFLLAVRAVQPHTEIADPKTFIGDLFSSFLFPPLSDDISFDADMDSVLQEQIDPILDMHTRTVLYEIILALSHTQNSLESVCQELSSDQIPKDFYFAVHMNNDRQSLRSEGGYAGLRNLSNTCYLNSLISQLFMNVEFRELVMNVNIIDHSKQRLLGELGKVFAYMQNSYEDAISPECAIDAITLWDGDQIDVTVQMDVDEFFNLLFDRLESQIVDPKVCNAFKGIYGGQLVQQIKSKECEHVSERLEPFAAVQVEIKGKATLEESLRAYVEGEVLQGENKYSCTGCGKHVDAVKRACLKTVPDHLIFNLKRFDYDIMTGMRCKVNDEFGFPEMIDMTPYTLEALTSSETSTKQDIFELVGVIVHSGTAESGHYYSYIRQRPSFESREKSWLQFNDNDVSQFDPASIKECCFGGIDFGAIQCPKFYNGYMLFYQRASSIGEFERKYLNDSVSGRVRIPASPDLDWHLSQQNEMFLRSYVAQDPTHAKFMRSLLQQVRADEKLCCNESHNESINKLLMLSINYLHRVSARWKDLPEVEDTLNLLCQYANNCEVCAKQILKWFMRHDHFADNVVRSCYMIVRKGFAVLAMSCWSKWSSCIKRQTQSPDEEPESDMQSYLNGFHKFLSIVAGAWDHVLRHGRSWDQYFGLLSFLVNHGKEEARVTISSGFLEMLLELIHVHIPHLSPKGLRSKYNAYLLQRERSRPFNHALIVKLMAELIPHVDFALPMAISGDRPVIDGRVGVSPEEAYLFGITSGATPLEWLRKVITGRSNLQVALEIVIHLCSTRIFDRPLSDMFKECLGDRHIPNTVASLEPTLVFIAHCTQKEIVLDLVAEALSSIDTTNGQYGRDFLGFVQGLLSMSNPELSVSVTALRQLVKKHVPEWAPVLLTAPNDIHSDVRNDTIELLNEILFKDLKEPNGLQQSHPNRYRSDINVCKSLAKSIAEFVESNFNNVQGVSLQAGQAFQAGKVAIYCLRFFDESASDEEEMARITGIVEEFKAKSEGIIETATDADWNASSDLEGISEVDNMSDTSN